MPESFAAAPYAFEAAQAAGAIEPQTAETTLAGAEPEPTAAAPIGDSIAEIEPEPLATIEPSATIAPQRP